MTFKKTATWVLLYMICIVASGFTYAEEENFSGLNPKWKPSLSPTPTPTPTIDFGMATGEDEGRISRDAIFGLVGAILGALIGAGTSLISIHLIDRATQRREKKADGIARQLVMAEVQANQNLLKQDWNWVFELDEPVSVAPIERSAMYPPPGLQSNAWTSNLHRLSDVFSGDEILNLQKFYTNVQSLKDVRQVLHNLYTNKAERTALIEAFNVYKIYNANIQDYVLPETAN